MSAENGGNVSIHFVKNLWKCWRTVKNSSCGHSQQEAADFQILRESKDKGGVLGNGAQVETQPHTLRMLKHSEDQSLFFVLWFEQVWDTTITL